MALDAVIARKALKATAKGPLVLLFYDGYELKAEPGLTGFAHSQTRRIGRYTTRTLKRIQAHTGFYAAFLALRRSLARIGCDVRVNDFALARSMPTYPIGVAGYPSVLDKVRLPNPMIFGPGDYGPPQSVDAVKARTPVRIFTQPSPWFASYYEPFNRGETQVLSVGIDTDHWPDWSQAPKDNDVLVYDKIRWGRDTLVHDVLERQLAHLRARGLSFHVLRYGEHHVSAFRAWLKRSRTMVFLCEHETQGLAYQEAMSTNVPVLAWDEGKLVDPDMAQRSDVNVSSVPYFDARCGDRFSLPDMEAAFDAFWAARSHFAPRAYVKDTLSLERCGQNYLRMYSSLAR